MSQSKSYTLQSNSYSKKQIRVFSFDYQCSLLLLTKIVNLIVPLHLYWEFYSRIIIVWFSKNFKNLLYFSYHVMILITSNWKKKRLIFIPVIELSLTFCCKHESLPYGEEVSHLKHKTAYLISSFSGGKKGVTVPKWSFSYYYYCCCCTLSSSLKIQNLDSLTPRKRGAWSRWWKYDQPNWVGDSS